MSGEHVCCVAFCRGGRQCAKQGWPNKLQKDTAKRTDVLSLFGFLNSNPDLHRPVRCWHGAQCTNSSSHGQKHCMRFVARPPCFLEMRHQEVSCSAACFFGWAVDAQKMPSPTQIGPKEQKCGLAQTGPGNLDPAKKETEQPIFPVRFVFCRCRTWLLNIDIVFVES